MKNTFVKHMLTLLLCLSIIAIGTLPAYATTAQISSFSGTITATSDTVDLSGIEVMVYSAEFVDVEDENALDYYAETYAFSVYTDENGEFHFTKPTTYCSISVELSSLPSGYGISQRTQFIRPQRNEIAFTISPIASIETELSGDEIDVTLLNAAGEAILAEYTVTANDQAQSSNMTATEQNFQTFATSLASIDALDTYTYTGTVVANGVSMPYAETVDLSELATDAKVDFLYAEGLLTEEQKMMHYCEILTSDGYTTSGDCGTSMIGELTEYMNSGKLRSNTNVAGIASLLAAPSYSDFEEPYVLQITGTDIPLYTFYIYYNESQIDDTKLLAFADEMEDVYRYFIQTYGFNAPRSNSLSASYDVFIYDVDSANGIMHPNTDGTSVISIDYTLSVEDFKHTFPHEYQHAITRSYGIKSNDVNRWVYESFASMSSLVYAGYDSTQYLGKLRAYLNHTDQSIFTPVDPYTDEFNYGALVFPLYIYENLGGWSSIKNIYTNYASTQSVISAITALDNVSDCGNVFNGCAVRNYLPRYFYNALSSATTSVKPNVIPNTGSLNSTEFSLAPLSNKYWDFTINEGETTAYSLNFTVEIEDGVDGILINTIKWDGNAQVSTPTIQTVSRLTFSQDNIGTGATKHFIVTIVNKNSSGTDITVNLTANYY